MRIQIAKHAMTTLIAILLPIAAMPAAQAEPASKPSQTSPASTTQKAPAAEHPIGTSQATSEGQQRVKELQEQYRKQVSPEEYQLAMEAYNASLRGESGPVNASTVQTEEGTCVEIPKWAVVAYGWRLIVSGGVVTVAGGLVDATIVGLPVRVVMNALGVGAGISGSALLYWADHTGWPKTICI